MKEKTSWEVATEGTYADKRVPRAVFVFVLALAFVIVALPSVGMLWSRTDSTTENRELAAAPSLFGEDGSFNWNILDDAGTYFADHFAYRNQMVSANARIRTALGASATDQVVVGSDGWLYYGGTLPDYLGQSALSDRALRNIAHNLALAQGYVESHQAMFAFALAPNKNTLYPSHMPYYYLQDDSPSNADRLKPFLEEEGVNYIDLFDLFENVDGEWYLKKDSHWDNRGALMVAQKILAATAHDPLPLEVEDAAARVDFAGDIESMLYPVGAQYDSNWYFPGVNDEEGMAGSTWSYVQGEAVTDSWVVTNAQGGSGSLLMFRDSFGNALLPLFASAYKQGVFSKYIPYNLPTMAECHADAVVVERAERHLGYLAENPPIMPNPVVRLKAEVPVAAQENHATLSVEENGPYWMISGSVDESAVRESSKLYVHVEGGNREPRTYDAFWTSLPDGEGGYSTDFGYLVYLDKESADLSYSTISVFSYDNGVLSCLAVFDNPA